jgi:hypothetical protein
MLGDATMGLGKVLLVEVISSMGCFSPLMVGVSHVLVFFTMKFFIVPKTNQNPHHSIVLYLCTYTTHTNKQKVF